MNYEICTVCGKFYFLTQRAEKNIYICSNIESYWIQQWHHQSIELEFPYLIKCNVITSNIKTAEMLEML